MNKDTVLVFGGNGFIGAEVVDYLISNNPNFEFVLLNRGNWKEWDSNTRIKSRIKENIIYDREKDSLKECLKHYLERDDLKFKAIIDFSAYKSSNIKSALEAIPANKIGVYIYISSDSVYEVCVDKKPNLPNGAVCLSETDSIRPESKEEQNKLKEFDSYGHHKFKAEEKLIELAKQNGFDYIALRLPDVIGPRDSLIRFWLYQMWLQFLDYTFPNKTHQVPIQKLLFNKVTSYVYVGDVARFIHFALNEITCRNDVINIGFETGKSVQEFLTIMAKHVREGSEKNLEFYPVDFYEKATDFDYPSVTKGTIDVSKMRDKYKFQASNWDDVMKLSVEFYNKAYKLFPNELETTKKYFIKKFLKKNNKEYTLDDLNKLLDSLK